MSGVFGSVYADSYDSLYGDKDYEAECSVLENVFRNYGGSTQAILDLGCGTGSHAIPLAQRGYKVIGVDRSADMLARARTKAGSLAGPNDLVFHHSDINELNLGQRFDAALMMFAVLGYQLKNADVTSALSTARRHLRAGGLLIFDVWYGPAVLHQRPSQRTKIIQTPTGRIFRAVSGDLDVGRHICSVDYQMWQLEGDRLVADITEHHRMRFFFPLELELFLQSSGFRLLRLGVFPDFGQDPSEETWNVLAVAQAQPD
jgi:SAM-dependent methyltransferase